MDPGGRLRLQGPAGAASQINTSTYVHTCIYLYISIYIYRERERESERGRERYRRRETHTWGSFYARCTRDFRLEKTCLLWMLRPDSGHRVYVPSATSSTSCNLYTSLHDLSYDNYRRTTDTDVNCVGTQMDCLFHACRLPSG